MKRFLLGSATLAWCGVLLIVPLARAETASLKVLRLDSERSSGIRSDDPVTWLYRRCRPQSFFKQLAPKIPESAVSDDAALAVFKNEVRKEPAKYVSKEPVRAVASLGSQKFGFVLDRVDEKSKGYDRLLFDLNHNGDLTDDKPIDAKPSPGVIMPPGYSHYEFPRAELTIEVNGSKFDYAFFFSLYSAESKDFSYVSASLSPAVCRVGEVTLDGKPHKVALVDYNSNGRFDDEMKLDDNMVGPNAQIYPSQGDQLFIDPAVGGELGDDAWEKGCCQVSKLVCVDGRFYQLKVSPIGDSLALTPSTLPLGRVTSPHGDFRALVAGDAGVVSLRIERSQPAFLPEGQWKLLSYTIVHRPDPKSPKAKDEKPKEEKEASPSLFGALARALFGIGGGPSQPAPPRITTSRVSAAGTRNCKPFAVKKDELTTLPFGPPYKPVVSVSYFRQDSASLGMSLLGSAGESCTDLNVQGRRPDGPKFTIATSKGEVVQTGKFSYG